MGSHRSRLSLAVIATVVAAGAATLILRPRGGVIDPAAVKATAYFSPQQLRRIDDFTGTQRLLGLGGLAISGATLAVLALRPPRRLLDRAGRRPLVGAAAAGAGVSLVLVVVGLPLSAVAHQRSVDVGLSTQGWGDWLGDAAKATAVQSVLAAGGGALGLALIRRFPRRWWLPGAACVVVFGALSVYLFPLLVDPIFNRFEPLPRGKLRSDVLALADRAGVDVGQVYRVDASRRTTGENAYVNGIGHSKRVVLYDNLIENRPEDEVRSVVAHELGHVKHRDIPRGLLWVALVAPAGTLLAQRLTEQMAGRHGREAGPAVIPALALSLALVSFALTCAGNVLSRRIEASADSFALKETRDPAAFIELERRLALSNVSDPDPPPVLHALFGTHPTTLERIGMGEAWARNPQP